MKIAIIGGGAAGLMAAITAAKSGADVTVYEQNDEPGKKILASGNGRCNIINRNTTLGDFEGKAPSFADPALKAMDFKTFERFCKSIGILLETKEDGKCYPLSHEAKSVQAAFARAAAHLNVTFINGTIVTAISRQENGFIVQAEEPSARFDTVVIATGSPAAPQLGGNESGMEFARVLGHNIISPFPSLVGLHTDDAFLEKVAGVKSTARVSLEIDGIGILEKTGDILFTRYGLSGFAILDLSYHASQALRDYAQVKLNVDLLPRFTQQALATQIEQMAKAIPDDSIYDLLCGLMPHRLIRPLLQAHKLSPESACRDINAKSSKRIAYALKQWTFNVTETHGYKHAEVSGGGIDTSEIDETTMASKIVPNLFFAGEVLDITGQRGGFNFHFAWGSGYLAGKYAAQQTRS